MGAPSKALIHAAGRFADMSAAAAPGGAHGLSLASPPTLNLSQTMAWKDGLVSKPSGGVASLVKRTGVRVVKCWGVFMDAKTCQVGDQIIKAGVVVLAAGSVPAALPNLSFGGPVLSSTEALSLSAFRSAWRSSSPATRA